MNCRICGHSPLDLVLDLGYHPPSDAFLSSLDEPETTYPLRVVNCPGCDLVQLDYTVSRETLFDDDYPYETGVNLGGEAHFMDLAHTIESRCQLTSADLVVDIGSNDGTLLSYMSCSVCGVEPVSPIARRAKVPTVCAFWDVDTAKQIRDASGKARVVTAANVLAHCDDLHEFVTAVYLLLTEDGTFVVESPSLQSLIDNTAYDTIYHEHLCYFSPKPLAHLFNIHGMYIEDIEVFPHIHGGSLRYYVRKGKATHNGYTAPDLSHFAANVASHKRQIEDFLDGVRFVGVSAPAKGNTFLNYNHLKPEYITEKSSLKIGKYTPGMHIPVVSDDRLLEDQPPFAILLAWNWKDQIMKVLDGYNGLWIIPFPHPRIE